METRRSARIGAETETDLGWSYELEVCEGDHVENSATVTLSWADHDLITKGLTPPSETVRAAIQVAFDQPRAVIDVARLPSRFDLSTLRRLIAGFDQAVRDRLR